MIKEFAQELLLLHEENEKLQQKYEKLFLWFVSALLSNNGSLPKYIFKNDKERDSVLLLKEKGLCINLIFGGNFELTFKDERISTEQFLKILQQNESTKR